MPNYYKPFRVWIDNTVWCDFPYLSLAKDWLRLVKSKNQVDSAKIVNTITNEVLYNE